MTDSELNGKKIFFVYLPNSTKEELVNYLISQEYEVYVLDKHKVVPLICSKYPNSILLIDIDEELSLSQWMEFIHSLSPDGTELEISIAVMSNNRDKDIREKILNEWKVKVSYIELKSGFEGSRKNIVSFLESNKAKGRRKYLRVNTGYQGNASLNIRNEGRLINGRILDISSFGMACSFDEYIDFKKNTLIEDIQLKLKGVLITTSGIVFGGRLDEVPVYVIVFDHRKQPINKKKIQNFIKNVLQEMVSKLV
ncbi:PilZ domain-containing protein [Spirochaeta cellobiosiphila]|uniref:PilZ domain-containing protein n=1 Tax=Spirochaeta cellobiosiphila TaxID=504483 RepID=UPI0004075920|nr:PilZ domain-containing protein [Spirochaeta cellobiosiphila]